LCASNELDRCYTILLCVFFLSITRTFENIYLSISVSYLRGIITVIGTTIDAIHLDQIDSEMVDYMAKRGKVKAGELAELVGITIPSIRLRLFQLMAKGFVSQKKTRDHQVWFFVTEKEAASCRSSGAGIPTEIDKKRVYAGGNPLDSKGDVNVNRSEVGN
jgi:hypothetical protein